MEVALTTDSNLGRLRGASVDFVSLSDEHDLVVNMESDAPGVIVDSVSVPELVEKFQSINTLDPQLSREIIEQRWKALQQYST